MSGSGVNAHGLCAVCGKPIRHALSWSTEAGRVHLDCHDWNAEPVFPFEPAIAQCEEIRARYPALANATEVNTLFDLLLEARHARILDGKLVRALLEQIDRVNVLLIRTDLRRRSPDA